MCFNLLYVKNDLDLEVEVLSTRLHSSLNLVGLALGNPLLSPKIQFRFGEMAQVGNFDELSSRIWI